MRTLTNLSFHVWGFASFFFVSVAETTPARARVPLLICGGSGSVAIAGLDGIKHPGSTLEFPRLPLQT